VRESDRECGSVRERVRVRESVRVKESTYSVFMPGVGIPQSTARSSKERTPPLRITSWSKHAVPTRPPGQSPPHKGGYGYGGVEAVSGGGRYGTPNFPTGLWRKQTGRENADYLICL